MPSNQPETPTPDALDAAVEEARARVRDWTPHDGDRGWLPTTNGIVDADLAALIAAVEARAVARAERVCEWRREPYHEGYYIVAACEGHTAMMRLDIRFVFCPVCGGRVRVESA